MSVVIYSPNKNPMQSGKAKAGKWLVESIEDGGRFIEPVMGWTGNSDTQRQVKLAFDSKDDAIEYAKRNDLEYIVREPKKSTVKIQAYSDNFTD